MAPMRTASSRFSFSISRFTLSKSSGQSAHNSSGERSAPWSRISCQRSSRSVSRSSFDIALSSVGEDVCVSRHRQLPGRLDPKTAYFLLGNPQDQGRLRLGQSLVPVQIDDLSLLLREFVNLLMELGPLRESGWVVAAIGRFVWARALRSLCMWGHGLPARFPGSARGG